MPGRNFVLAFSGGLDTSYGLAVLVDRGERVITVTVNTGGFSDAELDDIDTRSRALRGADAIAHGSTMAGNDHVRFDAVSKAMAPELEIVGLIRDEAHTREEERDFLRGHGHPVSELTAEYSFNVGILGTTIGGGETYGSWEYLPEDAWPTTKSIAAAPGGPAGLLIGLHARRAHGCG